MRYIEFCPDCFALLVHDSFHVTKTPYDPDPYYDGIIAVCEGEYVDNRIIYYDHSDCDHENRFEIDEDFAFIIRDLYLKGYKTIKGCCQGHLYPNYNDSPLCIYSDFPYIIIDASNIPDNIRTTILNMQVEDVIIKFINDLGDNCIDIRPDITRFMHDNPDCDDTEEVEVLCDITIEDLLKFRMNFIKALKLFPNMMKGEIEYDNPAT